MSEEEKKGGKYEEPTSKEMGGDDLEDISGGWQPGNCMSGEAGQGYCGAGSGVTGSSCTKGEHPHAV